MIKVPEFDVVEVFGRDPNNPFAWRVQLRNGTITNISVTAASSATINATLDEYNEVFKRLRNE